MTIAQALASAAQQGLDRLDAQMLLLHALGRTDADRAWLLAHDQDALGVASAQQFATATQRRVQGEPVAYITGHKAFYGLDLQVDPRVLVPRPDTETLVDWALELAASDAAIASAIDLGTGSGAIALALKSHAPSLQVSALDASLDALAVAQANAGRLRLDVRFRQGHWLDGVNTADGFAQRFDLIVSNPPYIAEGDPHLPALAHEPVQALTAGADGLDDIRRIVAQAPSHLKPGGWLLLEHGYDQATAVRQLLAAAGFAKVQSRQDLAGIERCSGGQLT